MKSAFSVSANLPPSTRKDLALRVLAKTEPVSRIAIQHQVSRKFLYQDSLSCHDNSLAAYPTQAGFCEGEDSGDTLGSERQEQLGNTNQA